MSDSYLSYLVPRAGQIIAFQIDPVLTLNGPYNQARDPELMERAKQLPFKTYVGYLHRVSHTLF